MHNMWSDSSCILRILGDRQMKKMVCEICGSNEIKKVDNGLFECQSCGVQYSSEEAKKLLVEITGSVKIDHSGEVENCIKRAQQFAQNGDDVKAAQYYNAALDLDADNAVAQRKVQEIAQQHELDGYFIVAPTVDPQENVRHFLEQLSSMDNMACDIYKQIAIRSVKEKYMTFYFMKGKYQVDWSATACHVYYENQTVYKEQYDSTVGRRVNKPVTEKVERVNYVPQQGKQITSAEALTLASGNLEAALPLDLAELKSDLIAAVEEQQDKKYGKYQIERLNGRLLEKKDGVYFYNGMELDAQADERVKVESKNRLQNEAERLALADIEKQIGGDYYENFNAIRTTLSQSTVCVCLPMQVIEYTYKGKHYAAVSDLVSHQTTIPTAYPGDKEMADAMAELGTAKELAQKNPGLGGLWLMGLGLLGVFLLCINFQDVIKQLPQLTFGCMIGGLAWLIGGTILQKVRGKQFANRAEMVKQTMFEPRIQALEAGKTTFFKAYTDYASAEAAAAAMDCLEPRTITPQVGAAGTIHEKMAYIANTVQEDDVSQVLDKAVAKLRKSRTRGIWVAVIGGLLISGLGLLLLNIADQTYIHTIAGTIYWIMIFAGIAEAAFGWCLVMGNRNEKIVELEGAREVHMLRKQMVQEGKSPEQLSGQDAVKWRMYPEDRIERTVGKARKVLAPGNGKKIWVVLGVILALAAVMSTVVILVEAGICQAEGQPYEDGLVGKTFQNQDNAAYSTTITVRRFVFGENNTVTYTCEEWDRETGECTYFYTYEETYTVHYEAATGEVVGKIGRQTMDYLNIHADTSIIYGFTLGIEQFQEVTE